MTFLSTAEVELFRRRNTTWIWFLVAIALVGVAVLLTIGNYNYASLNPGGNDFLVHWVGTRSFITEGISPYSDEVALRIQDMVYGRPALEGEHELRVAYPLYSIIVFLPFALIKEFTMARAVWMTVLEIALVALCFLSLRVTRWKPTPLVLMLLLIFSLFWYHGLRALILGNAVILVSLMVVGALLAIRGNEDEFAGVLLGFASIKPQVVVVLLIFIALWAINRRRWKIIFWMVGTIALLSAAAALLLPDWIMQNLREVIRYPGYNPPGTPAAVFAIYMPGVGQRVGQTISIFLAALLLIEWWLSLRGDFRAFLWAACLTLVASQWIGIQTDPGNFIVCYPALILVLALWDERWHRKSTWLIIGTLVLLFVGIWLVFIRTLERAYQPIQSPMLFFPLPMFLFIALYWVRWWAVRPLPTWVSTLTNRQP